MSNIFIYLAGPITNNTDPETKGWRFDMAAKLYKLGFRGISPLRCEPIHGERYAPDNPDPRFGLPTAITAKNFMDVQRCDLTLCYFPTDLTDRDGVSLGTISELCWAFAFNKPRIVVSTHPKVIGHPVISSQAPWILPTLDDAVETIAGLFGDYT